MHPDTQHVANHMREYAHAVLGRCVIDTTFAEITKPYAHAMAVTLAAHGAEILVKARIAEQHPLLIFDRLPKSSVTDGALSINELLVHGRTFMYSELPERLWAATGYRMARAKDFVEFGELRNRIMHFAVPDQDLSAEVLRFVFGILQPMADEFWGMSILDSAMEWDDVVEEHLGEQLERCGIEMSASLRLRLEKSCKPRPWAAPRCPRRRDSSFMCANGASVTP